MLSDRLGRKNSIFSVKREKNSVILKRNIAETKNQYLTSDYKQQNPSSYNNSTINNSTINMSQKNSSGTVTTLENFGKEDESKIIKFPRLEMEIINKIDKEKETVENSIVTPNSVNYKIKDINKKVYFGGDKELYPKKLIVEIKERQRTKPHFNILYDYGKNN